MFIGKKIRELRVENSLTQKELALKIHVAANTLCQFENGKANPSYDVLLAIANLFEVSTDYLLGRSDDFGNITIQKEKSAESISAEEKALLQTYRALNAKNRMHVAAYAQVRLEEQK